MDILKYLVELIGTCLFVYVVLKVTGVGANGEGAINMGVGAPLVIVLTLLGMIFAGMAIGDCHFNPAITVGKFMQGSCDVNHMIGYIGVQLIGALLAFKLWQMTVKK